VNFFIEEYLIFVIKMPVKKEQPSSDSSFFEVKNCKKNTDYINQAVNKIS